MITVEHLTKVQRRRERARAVDDVSFACEPGTVTGFLGPRGAGKSTTLRILTGLARPTSGRAEILGRAYRDLPNPGRAVGVMLDASALAPARTGRETLRLTAALLGLTDPGAVEDALADAGLRHAARTRVGAYPVGLRHRLAIANALLGDPAVLVLDEPVAGLDPNGVRWLWRVVRAFADEGGTVLISARRPDDLRTGVDRLVVIAEGRVVAYGSAGDLLGGPDRVHDGPHAAGVLIGGGS